MNQYIILYSLAIKAGHFWAVQIPAESFASVEQLFYKHFSAKDYSIIQISLIS